MSQPGARRKTHPEFYTTGDVARLLGCGKDRVVRWIDSGVLAGFRLPGGRLRRVGREALARFVVERPALLAALSAESRASLRVAEVQEHARRVSAIEERLAAEEAGLCLYSVHTAQATQMAFDLSAPVR